jgi:hypothetical protein
VITKPCDLQPIGSCQRHVCSFARALIPAGVLRERLAETLRLAEKRERQVYDETDEHEIEPFLHSFPDFVALCEAKERETVQPEASVIWAIEQYGIMVMAPARRANHPK